MIKSPILAEYFNFEMLDKKEFSIQLFIHWHFVERINWDGEIYE